jgi:hypothetical protein
VSAHGVAEEAEEAASTCGVDPGADVVPVEPAGAGAGAGADPKIELEAGDELRDGEPNEKPTLPALGGGEPSLAPVDATPNPNEAGVVVDDVVPKLKGDGFADEPKEVPNTLLIGGSDGLLLLSFSFSPSFSLSGFVIAEPNRLPGVDAPTVSPNNFVTGTLEKGDDPTAGADKADPSLSLSSDADLSGPKRAEVFGGLPKSEVLELGWLLPKGSVLAVEPAAGDAPNAKADFNEGIDSASFDKKGVVDLKREEEEVPPANPDDGDDEVTPAGLGSEDADVAAGKLKGDGFVPDAERVGVKPVKPLAGAAELKAADGAEKLAKLVGVVVGAEEAGLPKESGAAGMEGLVGRVEALCVVGWDDLPSYSCWTEIRCFLYCSRMSATSTKGSDSIALETAERNEELSPRREV